MYDYYVWNLLIINIVKSISGHPVLQCLGFMVILFPKSKLQSVDY